jgi:penicillin amidase
MAFDWWSALAPGAQAFLAYCVPTFWNLSHAWTGEIVRTRLIDKLGSDRAADLEIRYPERNPITLPQGIEFNRLTADAMLEAAEGPFLSHAVGSNGWAVTGSRISTGAPVLCNDMHLRLQLPAIWYAIHVVAGPSSSRENRG